MTNGSKVLIYLTLLYFIFYSTLVSNAKGNVAKSNKSKGPIENSKKMSWDNPVFPIDTKNSIGFFVPFFLG